MLFVDLEVNVVMVVGGYCNGDFVDYLDKNMFMMFNLGVGGGVIILKKNYGKNLFLGSYMIFDGLLLCIVGVEIGGIINLIIKENMDEVKYLLRLLDLVKMKNRFNDVFMLNWYKCIDEFLRKFNFERKDIDFLNILYIKCSGYLFMLNDLGLIED